MKTVMERMKQNGTHGMTETFNTNSIGKCAHSMSLHIVRIAELCHILSETEYWYISHHGQNHSKAKAHYPILMLGNSFRPNGVD